MIERKNVDKNDRGEDKENDRENRDKVIKINDIENEAILNADREDRENLEENAVVSYKTLVGIQKNIIQFCSIPRSAREILVHIGYAYNSTNISNHIKPLLQMGFLEMTEPDKPNSKNQKYRKVKSQ